MTIELKPGERVDELQRNGYRIIQDPRRFCFGMDAVLLSGFVQVKEGESVLDLGTGTGILPILLAAKTSGRSFFGLEIQPEMADMARRSVQMNGLEEKISIIVGDLCHAVERFGRSSMDVVVSNPPYMRRQGGLTNPDESKAIARHEILCSLTDVIREGCAILKPGGRFYLVHRPYRLTDLLSMLREYKAEPSRIKMVHPFVEKEANMVLIEAIRGGKNDVIVEKPLIVYREPGVYMEEISTIYGY